MLGVVAGVVRTWKLPAGWSWSVLSGCGAMYRFGEATFVLPRHSTTYKDLGGAMTAHIKAYSQVEVQAWPLMTPVVVTGSMMH